MNLSRSGCTAPVLSVARDFTTTGLPLHFHGMRKQVIARGSTGGTRGATAHVLPPSVDTSTLAMVPFARPRDARDFVEPGATQRAARRRAGDERLHFHRVREHEGLSIGL